MSNNREISLRHWISPDHRLNLHADPIQEPVNLVYKEIVRAIQLPTNNKLSDRFTNLIRHIVYKLHKSDLHSKTKSINLENFIRLLEGPFDRTGGSYCIPVNSKNGIVMIKGTKKDLVQEIFKVLANGDHGEHKNDQSDGSCCANPFHYPPPSLAVQLPAASPASSSSVIDVEKVETESPSSDIDVEN